MNAKQLTLLMIFGVFLFACKKSSNTPEEPAPTKKVKYLSQVTIVRGTTTSSTYYTYDAQKRLSTVKQGNTTTTYFYDSNKLSSIERITISGTDISSVVTQITYSDGAFSTSAKSYNNGIFNIEHITGYLVIDNKITEIHRDDAIIIIQSYDSNGNLIKSQNQLSNGTYTYSDKKNPAMVNADPDPRNYSSPNILLSSTSNGTNGAVTTTYTYEFDSKGFILTSATPNYKGTYTYDSDGYITTSATANITYPSQSYTTTYTYTEL
jgi:hypothetical protein